MSSAPNLDHLVPGSSDEIQELQRWTRRVWNAVLALTDPLLNQYDAEMLHASTNELAARAQSLAVFLARILSEGHAMCVLLSPSIQGRILPPIEQFQRVCAEIESAGTTPWGPVVDKVQAAANWLGRELQYLDVTLETTLEARRRIEEKSEGPS